MAKDKKAETAAEQPPVDKYKGLGSLERMFRQELDGMGVKYEGFIFTPPVPWMPKQLGWRLSKGDNEKVGMVPWGLSTFATLIEEARGL